MPELWRRWTCEGAKKMKIQAIFDTKNFCDFVERYCHNAKHRPIIIDRYCEGLTYAELADKYTYPERSIKYIIYKYDNLIIKFSKELQQG